MKEIIMWYAILGLITWAMGLYRETKNKSAGDADQLLVLAVIMFWPFFLISIMRSVILKLFK